MKSSLLIILPLLFTFCTNPVNEQQTLPKNSAFNGAWSAPATVNVYDSIFTVNNTIIFDCDSFYFQGMGYGACVSLPSGQGVCVDGAFASFSGTWSCLLDTLYLYTNVTTEFSLPQNQHYAFSGDTCHLTDTTGKVSYYYRKWILR